MDSHDYLGSKFHSRRMVKVNANKPATRLPKNNADVAIGVE